MKRILLLAGVGLALATTNAAADSFSVVPDSGAAAQAPNRPGTVAVVDRRADSSEQPKSFTDLYALWRNAGAAFGVPWQVLAAINKIESNFGENMGPSSAGAVGWMQFMPDTWSRWGMDANADGVADPWNATDAVYSAARYLAAAGAAQDVRRAVFAYNHAGWYVDEVLSLAQTYGAGGSFGAGPLDVAQGQVVARSDAVINAQQAVADAMRRQTRLEDRVVRAEARAGEATLLSQRLAWEKRAARLAATLDAQRARVASLRSALGTAEQSDAAANSIGAFNVGFEPSAPAGAPAEEGGYVFPVGGGPDIVSVSHTHHDYPAADIAAPEGSPLYALAAGVVLRAWSAPSGRCGIGFTFRADNGLTWTYCHLSQLNPAVVTGAPLTAGESVGLVGHTGHASGPHLHLQFQPATMWPQREPWFEAFAGVAFHWSDGGQAPEARFEVLAPAAGEWVVEGASR